MKKATIEMDRGTITIELFEKEAPGTVANFTKLISEGFYDGLSFHRVIPGFVAQGGCPNGNGTGGPGYTIPCETAGNPKKHVRGALSMAHRGPNTGGSQFFIVQNKDDQSKQLGNAGYPKPIIDAYKKGGYPAGDTKYTVFGQVIKGMDVVDTIANLEVDDNNKPKENLTVNSVEVIKDYKFK